MTAVATEIAGMPVAAEPAGLMTPLAAVAMIRGLDADGKIGYWRVQTPGVTAVDAVGMHESAAELHKRSLGARR